MSSGQVRELLQVDGGDVLLALAGEILDNHVADEAFGIGLRVPGRPYLVLLLPEADVRDLHQVGGFAEVLAPKDMEALALPQNDRG